MTEGRARRLVPYVVVALAASMWGTWPLFLRKAEAMWAMSPAFETFVVMVVLSVISGVLVLRDRVPVKARAPQWMGILWLGIADALNCLLLFNAYQVTSVAVAVLTHYMAPIFVAIAAPLLLKERSTARGWAAIGVSFAGLVVLLSPWDAKHGADDFAGAALGAGSAVFYASNVLVNKRLFAAFSTSELMFYHGLVAAPFLAVFVPRDTWTSIDWNAMAVLVTGSAFPGTLAGLMFVWGLRRMPASHATTLTLLEPLVAVLVGAIAFAETVGVAAAIGGCLILLGGWTVASQAQKGQPSEGPLRSTTPAS